MIEKREIIKGSKEHLERESIEVLERSVAIRIVSEELEKKALEVQDVLDRLEVELGPAE